MTTAQSPLRVLKAQADKIAQMMKAWERGEKVDHPFGKKLEDARNGEGVKVGIVMDDKIITIDIKWTTLRESSEVGLADFILDQMREARQTAH